MAMSAVRRQISSIKQSGERDADLFAPVFLCPKRGRNGGNHEESAEGCDVGVFE